jgi:exosortase
MVPPLSSSTVVPRSRWRLAAIVCCVVAFVALYASVMTDLAHDWLHDDNYSHGVFIVPLALYFAWERRVALKGRVMQGSTAGMTLVVLGLMLLIAGRLGAELFLTRVSIIFVLAGALAFLCGWQNLRSLLFPVLFLLLMIPIPAIIFNQIAFPLQLFASQVGQAALSAFNIPVLREGNVIILSNMSLEVAEACSGIRSLVSLLTLGIVYGYFKDKRPGIRLAVAFLTVPIAIITNGARVAGTGLAAHYYGEQAAQGFFHEFSGWLVFIVAFSMLFFATSLLLRMAPAIPSETAFASVPLPDAR